MTFADMILGDCVLKIMSIAICTVGPALNSGFNACEQNSLLTHYLDFDFESVLRRRASGGRTDKLEKLSDIVSVADQIDF